MTQEAADNAPVRSELDDIRPPEPPGPGTWLRKNLFNTWYNSIMTLIAGAFTLWVLYVSVRWVFTQADWSPVTSVPLLYLVGQYPRSQLWRVGLSLALVAFLFGLSWGVWRGVMRAFALSLAITVLLLAVLPTTSAQYTLFIRLGLAANVLVILVGYLLGRTRFVTSRAVLIGWFLSPILIVFLLRGVRGVLPLVSTNIWGGLMLTILLAAGGIVLSFPIGVLLALGRRSSLPVVRLFSTAFIEGVRGVPLIGILFMSTIIFPLFLPQNVRLDNVFRVLAGMTLFSAAYMAENVRGGLQAIPPGQVEAARAVGLSSFLTTLLIVLPQALRAVIPAIVGQFIGLFKDTTLAAGVGLLELLAIGQSVLQANPRFFSLQAEVYIFIAAVFWVFSYSLSYASRQVERALGVGIR
jgi:general L-amino acid transport system permease protein